MDARDTLLLACGPAQSRRNLRPVFEDSFNLLEADNGRQTLLFLEQNHHCIAALLLDITAPDKLDAEALERIGLSAQQREIPVVVITADYAPETVSSLFAWGATDIFSSGGDPWLLLRRIHNIVELYRHKWHLEKLVDEQSAVLRHSTDTLVDALSSIIEYRSVESGQHILRIRRFTQILLEEIARCCPEYELTEAAIRNISSAAALHDIGKIAIPDAILNKAGPLTAEERAAMQQHTLTGCRILESLNDISNREYLRYAHNICHYHHERWDGGGYPEGIAGDDIPICAQVVGLADAYDALTSKRVYKDAYSFDKARAMILAGECGAFSPKVLECFLHVNAQFQELSQAYADGHSPRTENFDLLLPSPAPEGDNSLTAMQAKYRSLLHYTNAAVAEVDLDQQLFHLVYNPDPNLTALQTICSLDEIRQVFLDQILMPGDSERFLETVQNDIPRFFAEGHTRHSLHFRIRNRLSGSPELYKITLLRLNPGDPERRRMLVLWHRGEQMPAHSAGGEIDTPTDAAIYDTLQLNFRCRNDAQLTLLSQRSRIAALTGYTAAEFDRQHHNRLMPLVEEEDRPMLRKKFTEQLALGGRSELTYRLRHKDGHPIWVLHRAQLVLDSDGQESLYNTLLDITRTKSIQDNYKLTLEQYRLALSQTGNVVFEWDLVNDVIIFSNVFQEVFGYEPLSANARANLSTISHFHPDDIPKIHEWLDAAAREPGTHLTEIRLANADGRYLWCRFRGTASHDAAGRAVRISGVLVNIDAEKRMTQTLQLQAERDALTHLLNKAATRKQVEDALSTENACGALLLIDLDNFKQINDQFGHLFGDSVLSQAAQELRRLFRAQDVVGRIGGDEFLVFMRDVQVADLVIRRCQTLLHIFENILCGQLDGACLGCSIGIAFTPEHADNYNDLFQRADEALYQAKDRGKNGFVIYDGSDPAYKLRRQRPTTHIDSESQPGLANSSIVQYAFHRLYESRHVERTVNELLAVIGREMNVSRVYIFENNTENTHCSNTFEWCNEGIEPVIDTLQNISYERDIPGFRDMFTEQGVFYCSDVDKLPSKIYNVVAPQGIKSLVHYAIRDNGVFRGYVGFDDCTKRRLWTQEQIEILRFFSEMLSVFLLKERAQTKRDQK